MKIFGRDPAIAVSFLEIAVVLLATFNLPGLSEVQAAAVVGLVVAAGGALQAWTTRDTRLAAMLAGVKALLAVGAVYGLALTEEQVGLVVSGISIVLGAYLRTQTSPAATALSTPPRPKPPHEGAREVGQAVAAAITAQGRTSVSGFR